MLTVTVITDKKVPNRIDALYILRIASDTLRLLRAIECEKLGQDRAKILWLVEILTLSDRSVMRFAAPGDQQLAQEIAAQAALRLGSSEGIEAASARMWAALAGPPGTEVTLSRQRTGGRFQDEGPCPECMTISWDPGPSGPVCAYCDLLREVDRLRATQDKLHEVLGGASMRPRALVRPHS